MIKQIQWFSKNHVAANFLMLIVFFTGFATWFKLKKEVFPDLALDAVLVSVPFPNASPDEVETGVILPIEDAIRNVEGVERFSSSSSEGMGALTIEVKNGYKVRNVMDDVKSKVDAITTFPEFAEKPIYEEFVLKQQVLSVAVSADVSEYELRKIAQKVRDGLLEHKPPKPNWKSASGVSQGLVTMIRGEADISEVELAAVKPLELSIEISQDRLRQYNLTIEQVAQRLRLASIDLPSGAIKSSSGDVLIRVKGKLYSASDFAEVEIVNGEAGGVVKLGDIASINDGFEDVELTTNFDGRRAVLVNVFRTGDEDSIEINNLVQDYINNVAPTQLPAGVKLELWNNTSKFLSGRLDLLLRSGGVGLLLVFIVLALFLRPSLAALVALGIPISFAGGVLMMPYLGVSINMISLFAFILVLGIVVDDAIVVGENVYGQIQKGVDPKKAAWAGTHEVGVVVVFGILTTMAAFTPMIGLDGVSGKIWPNIPYIVIPVLFFSLLQSKFVLPAHLAFLKPRREKEELGFISRVQHRVADGLEWAIEHIYRPLLKVCLNYRYVVLIGFIAVFALTVGLAKFKMNFDFMPKVEGDVISVKIEMPFGVKFDKTQAAVKQIEQAAQRIGKRYKDKDGNPVAVHILASSGTQPFIAGFGTGKLVTGSHLGEITVELAPANNRNINAETLINEWRKEIGQIPGLVSIAFKQETAAAGNALDIEITGGDLDKVKQASQYLVTELGKIKGVKDITTDERQGKRELIFEDGDITPQGANLGFTHTDVATQVRSAIFGNEVQRIQRGRDELKVMVRYPKDERESLETIDKLKLRSKEGVEVAISEVIQGRPTRGQATIHHINGNRSVKLSADVDVKLAGASANDVVKGFEAAALTDLSSKFPGVSWDFQGEQRDQAQSLNQMTVKFVFALFIMYILIAIPLKSYLQPMIIMSVIPFGTVGAIWGHKILGYDLSVMSVCGIIALAGVVVNDSLVLVEYVNRHRKDDGTILEAVWNAGARRFRPIMLTSLTTFAGLMPMLTETDMQAKFLIPMAISLGFGILFATLITLVLVPCVYLLMEDVRRLFRRS